MYIVLYIIFIHKHSKYNPYFIIIQRKMSKCKRKTFFSPSQRHKAIYEQKQFISFIEINFFRFIFTITSYSLVNYQLYHPSFYSFCIIWTLLIYYYRLFTLIGKNVHLHETKKANTIPLLFFFIIIQSFNNKNGYNNHASEMELIFLKIEINMKNYM